MDLIDLQSLSDLCKSKERRLSRWGYFQGRYLLGPYLMELQLNATRVSFKIVPTLSTYLLYLTLIHLHFIHVYAPRTKQQNSTLSCTTNSLQRTSSIDLLTSRIFFCYQRLFRKPRGRSITPAQDSRFFATRANAIDDQVYYRRHLPMYRYA